MTLYLYNTLPEVQLLYSTNFLDDFFQFSSVYGYQDTPRKICMISVSGSHHVVSSGHHVVCSGHHVSFYIHNHASIMHDM